MKIIYLHGLNATSRTFSFLRSQLPNHEAHVIEYSSHGSIENSIQSIVELLPDEAIIVGHSLGGVIGHLIASRKLINVSKLITISSPFGGSEQASMLKWFYPSHAVLNDIAPKSKIMREVALSSIKCPFLSLVSMSGSLPLIKSENDGVVTIESQMAVKATSRKKINANHFEIMQDDKTIKHVSSFIFKRALGPLDETQRCLISTDI